tara:strand:+ start:1193 stop:1462 length:270 start_codon:yes stop_codon:yes gene_type:complete
MSILKKSTSKKYRFGIVSYDIISDPDTSPKCKALYALLSCYADKERVCFPTKSRLADELGVSITTLKRYLKELYAKNYIKRDGVKIKIK